MPLRPFAVLRHQNLRPLQFSKVLQKPRLRSTATHARPASQTTRIQRLESRLPAFLRRYTTPLRTAPVSHISAFLLLHEITAIIPLFGLAATFHYFDWLPPWIAEGALAKAGVEKFGRYLRRKGWIVDDDGAVDVVAGEVGVGEDAKKGRLGDRKSAAAAGKWWGRGEGGVRLAVEFATAYAVTKMLLPVRLVFSVWATPAFARWTVVPVVGGVRKLLGIGAGKGGGGVLSPAAGTNAVGGGVLPKVK